MNKQRTVKGLSELCAEINIEDENVKALERRINHTLSKVKLERLCQAEKHGEPDHTMLEWLAIAMEEVGEVARAAAPWAEREDRINLESELIQCAAVFCAWAEAEHDRGMFEAELRKQSDVIYTASENGEA